MNYFPRNTKLSKYQIHGTKANRLHDLQTNKKHNQGKKKQNDKTQIKKIPK